MPDIRGLSDSELLDLGKKPAGADILSQMSDEEFMQIAGIEAPAPKPERTTLGKVVSGIGDIGISAIKGAIGLTEVPVGIADIVTGGHTGKALEKVGYRPKEAKEILSTLYSPEQQEAFKAVQEAKGFIPTIVEAVKRPSTIAHAGIESLPSILGGGAAARLITKAVPRIAPYVAGAIGEGLVGAGLTAEQIRQQAPEGLITPKQAGISVVSGIGTSLFGALGGKFAGSKLGQKLGITDVDTYLASGGQLSSTAKAGILKRLATGGITEGVFEELPQSAQEQVWNNIALDRPVMEGVPEAAAMGTLTGAAIGGGVSAISPGKPVTPPPPSGPLSKSLFNAATDLLIPPTPEEIARRDVEGAAFTKARGLEPMIPSIADLGMKGFGYGEVVREEAKPPAKPKVAGIGEFGYGEIYTGPEAVKPVSGIGVVEAAAPIFKEAEELLISKKLSPMDHTVLKNMIESVKKSGRTKELSKMVDEAKAFYVEGKPVKPEVAPVAEQIAAKEVMPSAEEAKAKAEAKTVLTPPVEKGPSVTAAPTVTSGITASEVDAIKDIPTTEKMKQALTLVGDREFKKQAIAKIQKYRPADEHQKAMLVEATAIEIIAKGQRIQKEAPVPPATPYSSGAKVKVGRNPQPHTIISEAPFNPQTDQPGERYFNLRNDKTGEDTGLVGLDEIAPIKGKGEVAAKKEKVTAPLASSYADIKKVAPDTKITIYRATVGGDDITIGDWVTPDKEVAKFYAKDIVGQRGNKQALIRELKVNAGDIRVTKAHEAIGVDNEFIYAPKPKVIEAAKVTPPVEKVKEKVEVFNFTEDVKAKHPDLTDEDISHIATETAAQFEQVAARSKGVAKGIAEDAVKSWNRFAETGELPIAKKGQFEGQPKTFGDDEFYKQVAAYKKMKKAPEEIEGLDLNVGDSFTVKGETHNVISETDDGKLKIQNGTTQYVWPDETVEIDKGSLKKAEVKKEAPVASLLTQKNDFITLANKVKELSDETPIKNVDELFDVSGKLADAKDTLADTIARMPDKGFALSGETSAGRRILLNKSTQKGGHWQLTRLDAEGKPWGDIQYPTKLQAIREFLDDIKPETLSDFGGQLKAVEAPTKGKDQEMFAGVSKVPTAGLKTEKAQAEDLLAGFRKPEEDKQAGLFEKKAEPAKAAEVNIDAIPDGLTLEVKAFREKTGKEVTIKEDAKTAINDSLETIKKYESLLECLKS